MSKAIWQRAIERAINDEIGEYARQPTAPLSDWPGRTWEYARSPSETEIEEAIREAAKGELDEEGGRELLRLRRQRCTFEEIEAVLASRRQRRRSDAGEWKKN